jgi:predicted RecA/RadA family phage recombinase
VARNRVLTGEAVGVAATDGVDSGNGSKVGEGAPRLAPELHMSIVDIRQGLAGDEKHGGGSSPVVAAVIHVIQGGQRRS